MSDFSSIDSNQKALELYTKGQLTKMYLMPLDFGGQEAPFNILYVPKESALQKESFDAKVCDMLEKGLSLNYSASPEYKGSSFIPSKLMIELSGDKTITEVIEIW